MRFTTRVSSPTATKHFNTSYDMSGNGANHGIAHDCLQLSQLPGNCGRVPRHSPVPKASMQYPSGSPDFKHQIWAVIAADLDGTTGSITSRFGHVDATMSTGTSLPLQALHTYVLHHAHFSVPWASAVAASGCPTVRPPLFQHAPFVATALDDQPGVLIMMLHDSEPCGMVAYWHGPPSRCHCSPKAE